MQDRICQVDETSCNARPDHTLGHSRRSKPGHARYAAESGSKFRAASQLMHLVKVARA
jgi:hypothetical protein